jgi:hypothetical protein
LSNSFNFNYGLEVIFDFGNQVPNTKNIQFSNADVSVTPYLVTAGLQSTPPNTKTANYVLEFYKCLRYFQVLGGVNVTSNGGYFGIGQAFSTTQAVFLLSGLSTMRPTGLVNPPVLTVNSQTDFVVTNAGQASPPRTTGMSVNQGGYGTFLVTATVGSGLTSGNFYFLEAGDLNSQIFVSAEL